MVEQDGSGDYGYDLAHEACRAVTDPGDRGRRAPLAGLPAHADADADAEGDLGYDMAHGS